MNLLEQAINGIQLGLTKIRREVIARPFVRHVSILTVANGVGAVLSFVQGILVARWLGPELYGVAALVMSVPALVYTFFDARSVEASVKYLSEFHTRGEHKQAAALCRLGYMIDFGVATLAFLGILLITPWASRAIVHRPELGWLLIIYAAAFLPRSLQGTSYAVLAVHQRFSTIALIEATITVIRVTLILGLVLAGWNVIGIVWGNALGMILGGLFYIFAAWLLINRSWGKVFWRDTWSTLKGYRRVIIQFLTYNNLNALLGMIPKQLDIVLLGYFRNPVEVGYYKLAKSLAATVGYLVGPLQSVTYPELAKLWGLGDMKALPQKVRKLAVQIGLPLGLTTVAGTGLIPFILPIAAGQAYSPAILATQIFWIGSAFWLGFFWLRPTFMALGEVRAWLHLSCLGMSILLSGMVIVTATWGFQWLAGWIAASQLWGHSMLAAWLIWRRWSVERTIPERGVL